MIYRIHTENKQNVDFIASIVARRFEGFNITETVGYWKGVKEKSLVIEIDTFEEDEKLVSISVYNTAKEIKKENQQEAVLVQILGEKSILV